MWQEMKRVICKKDFLFEIKNSNILQHWQHLQLFELEIQKSNYFAQINERVNQKLFRHESKFWQLICVGETFLDFLRRWKNELVRLNEG